MNKVDQKIVITAVILAIITGTAIYIHETDTQTIENRLLFNVRQELEAPATAEYLGTKEYQLIDSKVTVYTWRQDDTLYEAQVDEAGNIFKSMAYQSNSTLISMTPALAETLAEQRLITETEYPPGDPFLSEPTFRYFEFDDRGPRWDVKWGLHSGNYSISNVGFSVSVFMDTGKTTIGDNDFDEITDIPKFMPPTVSKEEAEQLAVKYFSESMNYTVIESTNNHGLEISSGDIFIDEPFRLYWSIVVSGMGQIDGVPTEKRPVFMVDAYTGELLASYYISWGWDTINWKRTTYPYYGSVYPRVIDHTPHEYEFPYSVAEIMSMLSDPMSLLGSSVNESFRIDVYDEVRFEDDLCLEAISLELVDDKPVIAAYWVKAYDWVKTGTMLQIEDTRDAQNSSEVIEGVLIRLDPETGERLGQYNYSNIGSPSNTLNITREQAINITMTSPHADPEDRIIAQETLVFAEPRIIKTDWITQLYHSGDFRRLYIADVNQTTSRVYWLIRYEKNPEAHGGYTGTYLVDAETSEVALALEDHPLPDLLFRGYAPEQVKVNVSSCISFNLTITAAPTLEAQLPVSINAESMPENVTILIVEPVKQLSGEKQAVFNITVLVGEEAEPGTHNIRFEISVLGKGTSAYTRLEIKNPEPIYRVEPRKPVFRIGETIAFTIMAPEPQNGSYITISSPDGSILWVIEPFDEWVEVSDGWVVPYFEQLVDGAPMTLSDEHPIGNWTWTYRYLNTTLEGGFIVEEAGDYEFGIGVTDLSEDEGSAEEIPGLGGPLTDLSDIIQNTTDTEKEGTTQEKHTPEPIYNIRESRQIWLLVIFCIIIAVIVALRKISTG